MNLLVLKKFNNYFNRKIIKYDSLDDYEDNSSAFTYLTDINFNPNDGVRTELVLGKGQLGAFFDFEKTDSPDYLVTYTTEVLHNPDEEDTYIHTIESRWFILETKRTRGGQYVLQLKRDSIADNLSTLINCPAFIRKGTVRDDNPLVVNDEGVKVNQIKQGETLLKDKTNSSWIVGYMAKNAPAATFTEQIPTDSNVYYETIENIAAALGISASVLSNVLTIAKNNPSYFVNDNVDIVGWINFEDQSSKEIKVIARSSDNLTSFVGSSSSTITYHNRTSDCFAKCDAGVIPANDLVNRCQLYWGQAVNAYASAIKSNWESLTTHPLLTRDVLTKLNELVTNETIIYKQGKYYRIKINGSSGPTNTGENYAGSAMAVPIKSICDKCVTDYNSHYSNVLLTRLNQGQVFINYNELVVNYYLEEVSADDSIPGISVTMSSTRNAMLEQPYDMFAIPASNTIIKNGANEYEVYGDYAQKAAMTIVKKLTNANVYDLQLLPYCPIPEIAQNNKIDITSLTSEYDYDWLDYSGKIAKQDEETGEPEAVQIDIDQYEALFAVDTNLPNLTDVTTFGYDVLEGEELQYGNVRKYMENGTVHIQYYSQIQDPQDAEHIVVRIWWNYEETDTVHRSIIIYPKTNRFSVSLPYSLSLVDSMKIDSQCELYRLVSPNYQGSFDFSVAKNGGSVDGFIADCTYKPYTPYIKVAPNFAWLYGTNYGDCRGLICGGDFSIGFLQDKWEEYQLQNKNYQNIFNREIQNLDVNQSIQRTQQYASGAINIANSAGQGAATGAMVGGGYGAIIGAAAAGGASAGGYIADNILMEKGMIEQRQFALDKYNLQLANIQALPYTLTKVGAFNINSKIWPFIEHYSCSEIEREAMRQKIRYEGMTIGIVDRLEDYMTGGYIQADLIRNDDIIDDPHQLEDIYIELTKGVYM